MLLMQYMKWTIRMTFDNISYNSINNEPSTSIFSLCEIDYHLVEFICIRKVG